jgi:hypothetical protein
MQEKEIRAEFDEGTITVYQAFNPVIARLAVEAQTFKSPPFKLGRMTWIKPSFLWMMYRSGWATKSGQERILAISIRRDGFDWALRHSCLSHFDAKLHRSKSDWNVQLLKSPVRIQWDPERNLLLKPLNHRSIQVGLSNEAVEKYVTAWVMQIIDITQKCQVIHRLVQAGDLETAQGSVPTEHVYPISNDIARRLI